MHTSSAICHAGRVPLREAFRGSVITCSRNNERLILSSWLAIPSPFSLFLFSAPAESARSRLIDLSLCRFLSHSASTSPLIVQPFVPYSCAPLLYTFLLLVVSAKIGLVSRMAVSIRFVIRFRVHFNRGREIWICEQVKRGKPLYRNTREYRLL